MNPAVIARCFTRPAHVVFNFLCPDLDVLCRRSQDTPFQNRFALVAFQMSRGAFQFDAQPATVPAEYGQQVLDRINFRRGRIEPAFLVSASAGADVYKSERVNVQLQADGENLSNVLDVIDFGGLFSGNAIGPPRSGFLRLTTTF